MNEPAIVIPFKGRGYKSRLSPVLDATRRRRLAYLLLEGVLEAVGRAGLSRRCFVISSDPEVRGLASVFGASFVAESRASGVNSAVRLAVRRAGKFERFVVLPSDLPFLSSSDVTVAVELGEQKELVISPSWSFNGTNLLLFSKRRTPALSYDDNSFWNHLASAARRGLSTAVLTRPGILFDLDSPADVEELLRLRPRTSAARFLRESLNR
ncbi:MAG: 2-phospho-L-lactate guanylyltransferase [Nitrososphaerales archaeon]|nr:2-phospho-L-lactate guanylyltransferase [Nitrososphaerales archaeon]